MLQRGEEMRTQSSAAGRALLKSLRTSTHPLQPPVPGPALLQTRRVPKVTCGPRPEPCASCMARPSTQPRPLLLTVSRDACGEPDHETPPARGAEDHLQGPARSRFLQPPRRALLAGL